MNKARDIKNITLGAVVAVSGLSALAAVNLTTFAPGTPIKSSEVNANFSSLKANIEALQAPGSVSGAQLAAGSVNASKLEAKNGVDGKVLKLSGGNLIWGDDIVGSPSTSYTADGSSLVLAGTIFSVKDTGIGTTKIADEAVTGAKIAPNAVAYGRIADGGVPGTKLQLPLTLSGGFGNGAVIKGVDSGGNGFGVWGESTTSTGVYGKSTAGSGFGVQGKSDTNIGVLGDGAKYGVFGNSGSGFGVYGQSSGDNAVYGVAFGTNAAVAGTSAHGYGAYFEAGNAVCKFHAGATGWDCSSDRNLKHNFNPVNTAQVLEAIARMPITTWSMKGSTIRQMGPTAQDFYAAFKLGTSDKSINNTDAQGVALAAIKGMYEKNRALENQVKTLESRLVALEKAVRSR
jgi:Chaperone of endosialidase